MLSELKKFHQFALAAISKFQKWMTMIKNLSLLKSVFKFVELSLFQAESNIYRLIYRSMN